jgi:hypothetical protein
MSLTNQDYLDQLREYLDIKLFNLLQEAEFIFTHNVDITRKYNYSIRLLEISNIDDLNHKQATITNTIAKFNEYAHSKVLSSLSPSKIVEIKNNYLNLLNEQLDEFETLPVDAFTLIHIIVLEELKRVYFSQ